MDEKLSKAEKAVEAARANEKRTERMGPIKRADRLREQDETGHAVAVNAQRLIDRLKRRRTDVEVGNAIMLMDLTCRSRRCS